MMKFVNGWWIIPYIIPYKPPTRLYLNNVVKTIINHPIFDGLYHPFMVNLGMVYGIVLTSIMGKSILSMGISGS